MTKVAVETACTYTHGKHTLETVASAHYISNLNNTIDFVRCKFMRRSAWRGSSTKG